MIEWCCQGRSLNSAYNDCKYIRLKNYDDENLKAVTLAGEEIHPFEIQRKYNPPGLRVGSKSEYIDWSCPPDPGIAGYNESSQIGQKLLDLTSPQSNCKLQTQVNNFDCDMRLSNQMS